MNTKKAYDDFYQLLQNGDEIKISYKLFDILENYAKARLKDLVGIDIPLHIYFQEEMLIEKEDIKDYYVPYRVNPYTNEICREEWNMGTRAFYNEKGVFVDFSVTDNYHRRELKGYTKISHLIDFALNMNCNMYYNFIMWQVAKYHIIILRW